MEHPGFFQRAGPIALRRLIEATGARPASPADLDRLVHDLRPLSEAREGDLSFFDNTKYLAQFRSTRAAACFVAERFASQAPTGTTALVVAEPYRAFGVALAMFYPDAMRPRVLGSTGWAGGESVHPSAVLEGDVHIEPGAMVGPEAHIGKGSVIAAGAVIGYRVHIGRDCFIGPNANITHALIGNRVIIHAGVCIGQDGFGFAMGRTGHLKVPQVGRVIIQDDVEIGANSTIDRGALRDTIVGEGTKIDNLVQIGHNVVIGRHCIIVAQCGISGSTELEDFVVLGGQTGLIGHIRIGAGAQIAGNSGVRCSVPPGERWGGSPAAPIRRWFREIAAVKRLAERSPTRHTEAATSDPDAQERE